MKTISIFLLTFFLIPAFATLTLNDIGMLQCTTIDGATVDKCYFRGKMESTDAADFKLRCTDEYTVTAGEQTDLDAILVNAIANTKTVRSIP